MTKKKQSQKIFHKLIALDFFDANLLFGPWLVFSESMKMVEFVDSKEKIDKIIIIEKA